MLMAAGGSWLDLLIAALVGFSFWTGWRRGFLLEVLSYGGLLVGLVVGAILAPGVAGLFSARSGSSRALVSIVTLFGVAAVFQTAGFLIGIGARRRLHPGGVAHGMDSAGGAAFSALAMLIGVWFLGYTLVSGPSPALSTAIRGSAVLRAVDRVAPAPPNLLAAVRRFLDTSGFPEVLSGINPSLAPPIPAPNPAEVETAELAQASRSTVKVLGEACGGIQEGSGFVAAEGLVVTNAHVVAGMESPRVLPPGGGNLEATTVAYDPDRDLAVLAVAGLEASPLTLVDEHAGRGTPGKVFGYPENSASLVDVPAAVRGELRALGRDIYFEHQVERQVYVVQAKVRPGNSGGPLVGTDGRVIGVVFAAAVGEDDTGYALTDDEVRPVLAAAGQARVGTGPCRG